MLEMYKRSMTLSVLAAPILRRAWHARHVWKKKWQQPYYLLRDTPLFPGTKRVRRINKQYWYVSHTETYQSNTSTRPVMVVATVTAAVVDFPSFRCWWWWWRRWLRPLLTFPLSNAGCESCGELSYFFSHFRLNYKPVFWFSFEVTMKDLKKYLRPIF